MATVGSKSVRVGGGLVARSLGEEAHNSLPRAKHGESIRLQEAVYDIDLGSPEAWARSNGKQLRLYLARAVNRINDLERKLEELMRG